MTDTQPSIRPAIVDDLGRIDALLESLNLPTAGVSEHLGNFLVLVDKSAVVGCVGLEVYGSKGLLRSLAVKPELQGQGLGNLLYQAVTESARQRGIAEIYLLTETAEAFFVARGFQIIARDLVDEEVKASVEFSSACPQSAVCMSFKLT